MGENLVSPVGGSPSPALASGWASEWAATLQHRGQGGVAFMLELERACLKHFVFFMSL